MEQPRRQAVRDGLLRLGSSVPAGAPSDLKAEEIALDVGAALGNHVMMRVLMVGDLHCNTASANSVFAHAARLGADVIVQVGDFGFWPRTEPGRKFLRKAEARLASLGLELWWVDGNHDDLLALSTRPIEGDGRRRTSEHMWHLPRGHRWVWDDTVWLAAGGAVSMDRYGRREGVSWFRDESLADADVDQFIADGAADVIVAHDGPWTDGVLGQRLRLDLAVPDRGSSWPEDLVVESDAHMRRLRRLTEGVQAHHVFHGHHHARYDDVLESHFGRVEISGLGDDRGPIDQTSVLVDGAGRPIA